MKGQPNLWHSWHVSASQGVIIGRMSKQNVTDKKLRNLTENQITALRNLKELVDFAYAQLGHVSLAGKIRQKKNVLLPLYVGAIDLLSSVHILLAEERVSSAMNLNRILMESWANARFIYLDGRSIWIDSYFAESELGLKKWVKSVRDLRVRHPSADTGQSTFNDARLAQIERNSIRFLQGVKRRHPTLPTIPGITTRDISTRPYTLRDKFAIMDFLAAQKRTTPLKLSDEWQYLIVYKYFSGGTHIDARYMNSMYLQYTDKTITLRKHGNLADLELAILTASGYFLDMMSIFSHQFGYPKSVDMKLHKDRLKELHGRVKPT